MFRFRIWDREEGRYLDLSDRYAVIDHNGDVSWHDGDPVDPIRYEFEPGNGIFFHNDIVEAEVHGGSWNMFRPDRGGIPSNCRSVFRCDIEYNMIYWNAPVTGVVVFRNSSIDYEVVGLTENDVFYYPDGPRFSLKSLRVVGNIRTDEFHICPHRRKIYNNMTNI